MSFFSALTEACQVIGIEMPVSIFGNSDRGATELAAVANEVAEMIVSDHEWRDLMGIATITGDGATTQFALPSDYSRMAKSAELWSSRLDAPFTHISDVDRWLEISVRSIDYVTGAWTIYGGNFHITPAPAADETIQYFYVANRAVTDSSGSKKARFTSDLDTFFLGQRVLKLGIIWQWKANKGRPYGEDMATFQEALSRKKADDKGARVVSVGTPRLPRYGRLAYPVQIV